MSWQWVVFVAVVALWTLGLQTVHSWKEVRMMQRMPDEVLKQSVEDDG
jgi:hypothetical protein